MRELEPTLESLQETIDQANEGISYAQNVLQTGAAHEVPTPETDINTPLEELTEKLVEVGMKRLAMVEEVKDIVLPDLEAVKNRRIDAQTELLDWIRFNLEMAIDLKERGFLGETEIQMIDAALAALPEELADRIRDPKPAEENSPVPQSSSRKRFGLFRRNAVTPAINTIPQTPKHEVAVPEGFESVLHHPLRHVESTAERVATSAEVVEATVIPVREPEPVGEWDPEEYEKVPESLADPASSEKVTLSPLPPKKDLPVESSADESADKQTQMDWQARKPNIEVGLKSPLLNLTPEEENEIDAVEEVLILAEIDKIFKKAPQQKAAFLATYRLPKFRVEDLVKDLSEEAIAKGKITLAQAKHNILTNVIPRLISRDYSFGHYEKERDGREMVYRFVPNDSETIPKDTVVDTNGETSETESINPFKEGTGPKIAYDSLRTSQVALSYEEWALATYEEQLANGDLTLQEAVNNLNKIVTRNLKNMDPKFGTLIVSKRYGDVTRFILKPPDIEPRSDINIPDDEKSLDLSQDSDSSDKDEVFVGPLPVTSESDMDSLQEPEAESEEETENEIADTKRNDKTDDEEREPDLTTIVPNDSEIAPHEELGLNHNSLDSTGLLTDLDAGITLDMNQGDVKKK